MKFLKKGWALLRGPGKRVYLSQVSYPPSPLFFLDFPHFPYQIFVFVSIAPDNKDNNNAGPRRKTML